MTCGEGEIGHDQHPAPSEIQSLADKHPQKCARTEGTPTMVGVPRSQGCKECRQRKKGCDLRRPRCGRCARVGVRCGYGGKQWTFVEQSAVSGGPQTEVVALGARRAVATTMAATNSLSDRHLRRTAFEAENLAGFWEWYLPREDPGTVCIGGVQPAPWSRMFMELADCDEGVGMALQACALLVRSRVTADLAFRHAALGVYAQALKCTNRALQDAETAQSDGVLAACRALANFELLRGKREERVSSQAGDWLRHVDGAYRIVQLRGPERHVMDPGQMLWEECRMHAVLAGIVLRRPDLSFERVWKSVRLGQEPGSLRDDLYDILVWIPDLLWRNDQLLDLLDASGDCHRALQRARAHIAWCIRVAESLRQWEESVLEACFDQASELYMNGDGPLDLLAVCNNHGLGFFHMVMEYWTACILVFASAWISHRKAQSVSTPGELLGSPQSAQMPKIPEWMNATTPASCIVQSAAKYFTPEAGYWGAQMSIWGLGVTMHFYASVGMVDSAEMKHLRALIHIPKVGQMAAQWLRSMANLHASGNIDPGDRARYERVASAWFGTDRI